MADTYDLRLVQNERYRRSFRYKVGGVAQNLTTYTWRAQVRSREAMDAELLLNLTPYMTLNLVDATLINLTLPASVTRGLVKFPTKGAWDLFLWPIANPDDAVCLLQGGASLDLAATVTS